MTKLEDILNCNESVSNEIKRKIIIALFDMLYSQNQITKSELDSLALNINRTFNFN